MIDEINIVSFDVPFPANYGGVIDVFYKLKTFHKMGVKVHLHCFEYGRGEQEELKKYCETVTYYKRKKSIFYSFSKLPFIVQTRASKNMLNNLLKNNFSILFEGLHTCFLLNEDALKNRIKIYRESNIEHQYYAHLARNEANWIKKIHLINEAKKLEKFEPIVNFATHSFLVSKSDYTYFKHKYPKSNPYFIPSFHSNEEVILPAGKGKFVLYHGNLSVSENYEAAIYLIREIFSIIKIPFIIAGLNPTELLKNEINKHSHITLIANPSEEKMSELIHNAQINLLHTNQATGLKLKLLNVLYKGRHCLVNSKMVEGTTLSEICIVEDSIDKRLIIIKRLMEEELLEEVKEERVKILSENYSNKNNFNRIMKAIET